MSKALGPYSFLIMNDYEFTIEKIHLSSMKEKKELEDFLSLHQLKLDQDIDLSIAIRRIQDRKIVGTASAAGKVLKDFAVLPDYQGEGLTNRLISELIHDQTERGFKNLFVFTKPENSHFFESLGFSTLVSIPSEVVLLENSSTRFKSYIEDLKKKKTEGQRIGSIVMNCNPFTLGHRYLIEKASEACDVLHLFIVWENASLFPNEVRFKLVQEGIKDLKNIILHKGEDYIISKATFPTYFIKSAEKILQTHARLDLTIFSKYIAPALGINKRFVGTEPLCPATHTYNETMKQVLPQLGIAVDEIPRIEKNNEAISASRVRELIRSNHLEKSKDLLPSSTWNYLHTVEAQPIIEKIKQTSTRH